MLRVRRGELGEQRFHGALLPDDLAEVARAQKFHDRLRQVDAVELLKLLALLGVLRRFRIRLLLLDDLLADVIDVVLVLLLKLLVDLLLDAVLDILARALLGDALRQTLEHLWQVLLARGGMQERILVEDALQGQHALTAPRGAQEIHRVHAAGLYDERIGADEVDERLVERIDLAVDWQYLRLCGRRHFLLLIAVKKTIKKGHIPSSVCYLESKSPLLRGGFFCVNHSATTLTLILLVTDG